MEVLDYEKGLAWLPKSNVLEFIKNEREKVIIRPYGTEPKIKCYFIARGENKEEVLNAMERSFKAHGAACLSGSE